jgi:hypothetical protein
MPVTLATRSALFALAIFAVPSPGQVLARGKPAGPDDARAYAEAVRTLARRPVTVSWEAVDLEAAVKELRLLLARPILFAAAAEDRKTVPVTLELRNVSFASLFRLVEGAAKVRFLFEGGFIFVTTPEDAVRRSVVMRVYDVSDLLYQAPDFPAPVMSLHPGRPAEPPAESESQRRDGGEIVDLMRTLVGLDAWEVEGASIAISGRLLVVTHTPEVHAKIREFIAALAALL